VKKAIAQRTEAAYTLRSRGEKQQQENIQKYAVFSLFDSFIFIINSSPLHFKHFPPTLNSV